MRNGTRCILKYCAHLLVLNYTGASAFGRLKEFDREIAILEELLMQSRWRRGKRGAWYDRWALILMHHLVREKREVDGKQVALEKDEQSRILKQAMQIIVRGLEDEDTHIGMVNDTGMLCLFLTPR